MSVTASQLYDHDTCPHRVTRDLFDDIADRDEVNPFVQLLWERGTIFEQEVINGAESKIVDLSNFESEEKESRTLEAMKKCAPLIYGGRISHSDLIGQPDLLKYVGNGYIAGDIKSGTGFEGDEDDGKLKSHYALQLALYTDILEKIGFSADRRAFVWDIKKQEISYPLTDKRNSRTNDTWWDFYESTLSEVRQIQAGLLQTDPAYSANCKLCHWYSSCKEKLISMDDLTLLPEVGAGKKKLLQPHFDNTLSLANADLKQYIKGSKTIISGIGPDSLLKFQKRAQLRQTEGQPYFESAISLPQAECEIFYDIEVDPMRDICYLHGFIERQANGQETFTGFMVDEPTLTEEKRIFEQAINYLRERENWVMYYYSPYERTWWRKLQSRYPELLSADEVDQIYVVNNNRSIDLYYGVATKIIWPTIDHSVKTLAKYFGFSWRDSHPSGAASVEWFDKWVKSRNPIDKQRIIDYNEDDCIAMRVVLDGIRSLCI